MARQPFNPDLAQGGGGPLPAKVSGRLDLTVSQITRSIKEALELALPSTVHVVGQLSNVKRHSSGHFYFTLKDDSSELACVMWRSQFEKLKFQPEDGSDVRVTGSISVFERSGRVQLYARKIEPRGVGAMELAFRQLCEKLKREGLFEPTHKKKLPRYPQQIAVVTSPTGDAIEDILNTLKRRYPLAKVYLYPAVVQGPGAPRSIVRACRALNRQAAQLGGLDLMIVGRGGGSAEDLAAFNDESVARAIHASGIPVISAVGHEADLSIADLVADIRAATPTAAAELAVPNTQDVLDELHHHRELLSRYVRHQIQMLRSMLTAESRRKAYADPLATINERRTHIRQVVDEARTVVTSMLHRTQKRVATLETLVRRIGPEVLFETHRSRIRSERQRLTHAIGRRQFTVKHEASRVGERLTYLNPGVQVGRQQDRLGSTNRRIHLALEAKLKNVRQACTAMSTRLDALSHKSTLARGFSITRSKKGGKLIRSCEALKDGDRIVTELVDGSIDSRVLDSRQPELFD